jgi:flagellar basal-body rod protein FlgB
MTTAIFDRIGTMEAALDYHMARQNAISANIANVDTPGYAPRELVRPELDTDFAGLFELARTDARHMSVNGDTPSADSFDVVHERVVVPGNDKNYVSLEHEMARLTANSVRYEAVARLVSQHLGVLSYASSDAKR